jgi:hypothetical protein
VTSTDVHQHLWPPSFFTALAARSEPPRLRGRALELAGAPSWELDVESHELDNRLALMDRFQLDRAVVSLQPTLGVDRELMGTREDGILELAARRTSTASGIPAGSRPFRSTCTAPRSGGWGITTTTIKAS